MIVIIQIDQKKGEAMNDPMPNTKLLIAIRSSGMRQYEFADKVNEHPTFISRVVNGWVNLDKNRKIRFAESLGMEVEELFGN